MRAGIYLRTLWPVVQCRAFSAQPASSGVDKALLSKLRKQTGIPFINCKKALAKFDNDFDKAKEWLVSEAQKEGWARATKLQSRPMSQGLIAVLGDGKQATMLEVNCETDFVAKNEKFVAMVTKLVQECNIFFENQAEKKLSLDKAQLGQIVSSDQTSLADLVALNVGSMGENMALRRGAYLRAAADSTISYYVHPATGPPKPGKHVLLGKYGAVLEMRPTEPTQPDGPMATAQLGSHLCQHIVGMNPRVVGEYTPPDPEPEGNQSDTEEKSPKSSSEGEAGEEDAQEEGMSEGNVDEDALLQQDFLLDTTLRVGELLCMNSAEVLDFARFACGEEVEGEKEE